MTDILTSYVDGQPVLIEIESAYNPTRSLEGSGAARGFDASGTTTKALGSMTDALDSAKATILNVAHKMVTAIRADEPNLAPDEFELQFNLKFNAEGKAIIAKISGEASLSVKMTYRRKIDSSK